MALLDQVLGSVIASRMGRGGGGLGGALGGALGGPLGGALGGGLGGGSLGGAAMGGMLGQVLRGGGRGGGVGKALLLLLAGKFAMDYLGKQNQGAGQVAPGSLPGQGGVLGGGGLGSLVEQFRRTGHGGIIDSWLKPGPNQRIAPNQLAEALGPDTVQNLTQQSGLERDELLEELSETLPDAVDQMTPDGALPHEDQLRPARA